MRPVAVDAKQMTFFKPRVSFVRTWRFLLGIGLGLTAGVVILFFRRDTGLVITGFLGGVLIYLLAQTFALGSQFGLQARGILAQRFYRQHWFPANEISRLVLVSEAQVGDVLVAYQNPEPKAGLGMFKAGQRLSQFIEYCTVTLVTTERKRAGKRVVRHRPPEEEFVLLTLNSGKQYLLSPRQPAEFIDQYHRLSNSSR